MIADQDKAEAGERHLTIRLSVERLAQLEQLLEGSGQTLDDLATELLEAEIEAQHGLTFGPYLRRFMYR